MDRPNNWLVPSILSTLCCCLPLGIVGIIQASKVNSLWDSGNQAGAIEAAGKAKFWTLLAVGIGFVVQIIVVALQVMAGVMQAAANS